jgi:hypothetical protein
LNTPAIRDRSDMYVSFSVSDEDGQIEPSIALEIRQFKIHGFIEGGLIFDIQHLDNEWERLKLMGDSRPFAPMSVGKRERIMGVRVVDHFPASVPVSKTEFRERFGCGKLLQANGCFG